VPAGGNNLQKNVALSAAFKHLVAAGDKHLYYAKGADIFAAPLGLTSVNPSTGTLVFYP